MTKHVENPPECPECSSAHFVSKNGWRFEWVCHLCDERFGERENPQNPNPALRRH